MRIIQLILYCILFYSCNYPNIDTKLTISNTFRFLDECKLSSTTLSLPCNCEIESKDYDTQFDKYNLRHDSLVITVQFDTNSSDKNILESLWYKNIEDAIVENNLFDPNNREIKGKIELNKYIYAFEISEGYLHMFFDFSNVVEPKNIDEQFEAFINEIRIEKIPKPIPIKNSSTKNIEIIEISKSESVITGRAFKGELLINNLDSIIDYYDYNNSVFMNCDEIYAYYTDLILPYINNVSDGTILTIYRSDELEQNRTDNEVIFQFIVRIDDSIGFDILRPIFMSQNVKVKHKKYAGE